jgi:hypothetical protein
MNFCKKTAISILRVLLESWFEFACIHMNCLYDGYNEKFNCMHHVKVLV